MATPIVVLSEGDSSSQEAVSYAAHLAKTMAVPLRQFRVNPLTHTPSNGVETPKGLHPNDHFASLSGEADDFEIVTSQALAAVLLEQDALLVVMQRLSSTASPLGYLAEVVHSLLQTTQQPLLLVPSGAEGQVPPLRIGLVTDGDPFTLVHGQRAMHALLLTLPIQITVLHAPMPESGTSLADALQSVLSCGLAARYPSITTLEIQAHSQIAGILMGIKQMRADLIVLIIRHHSLLGADFGSSTMAALFQQSPIPVLLLLASDA